MERLQIPYPYTSKRGLCLLNNFGAKLTEEWFYQHCGTSALEMIELLNSQFYYELDSALLNAERKKCYQSMIHTVEEIQEIAEIARANYGKVPILLHLVVKVRLCKQLSRF
jgi:hypothetical protein